ncbi:MAG: DUF3987 domain-containing protein, partial [Cyanobacteria bacterium REEB65]|nr:DUF3987 domain-containing protein [Cyanobacteria bacterium REEB65]
MAGQFVALVEPHSEADPAALLLQFLAAIGNVVGRHAFFQVEADRHFANEFVGLVGASSVARKGTSWGHVRRACLQADEAWVTTHIVKGLSSGEGLIEAVRDRTVRHKEGEEVVEDDGVADKRLLVVQPELATVLRVIQREGNTLSAILRESWDSGNLGTLTRKPLRATGAHISIIGHITRDELLRYLDRTELANGLANRFLWAMVRRSKLLPDGGNLTDEAYYPLATRLAEVVAAGPLADRLERCPAARRLWHEVYPTLEQGRPGLLGAVLSRASAHVTRLSLIYALADCSPEIQVEHLQAALSVWRYCEESARFIFGDALGDPVADGILEALRARPEGMTRTEIIRGLFHGHRGAAIGVALGHLAAQGLARATHEATGGRDAERWFVAAPACDQSARSEEMEAPSGLRSLSSLVAPVPPGD